jgi:hypothetical protein
MPTLRATLEPIGRAIKERQVGEELKKLNPAPASRVRFDPPALAVPQQPKFGLMWPCGDHPVDYTYFPDGRHIIGEGTIGPSAAMASEHYACNPPFGGAKLRWCQAIGPNSWAISSDGGRSFRLSQTNLSHDECQLIPHGANGLRTLGKWPQAYDQPRRNFNTSTMQVYSVDPSGQLAQHTEAADIRYSGLPVPVWEFLPFITRPVQFASGQWLHTVTVQYSTQFDNGTFAPMGPCCNDSVVAYGSSDGLHWQFLSVVADKNQMNGTSDEGPNVRVVCHHCPCTLHTSTKISYGRSTINTYLPDSPVLELTGMLAVICLSICSGEYRHNFAWWTGSAVHLSSGWRRRPAQPASLSVLQVVFFR